MLFVRSFCNRNILFVGLHVELHFFGGYVTENDVTLGIVYKVHCSNIACDNEGNIQ